MSYIRKEGIYSKEDMYAIKFMNAFNKLDEKDKKAIIRTRVEDTNSYLFEDDYLQAYVRLADIIYKDDEGLAEVVLNNMIPGFNKTK